MTATPSVLAPLLLGFALGIRHALDPDHLAAMGTIVARERSPGRAAILGSIWGVGHSTALFLASLALIVWRIPVPAVATRYLELGVAAMLIALVILPSLPDRLTALVYVALFGIGSVGGMALWSAALAVPLGRLTRAESPLGRWIPAISGAVSVGCGIVLATQVA